MAENVKPFWQSKTFWANLIMGAAAFVPSIQNFVTPDVTAAVFVLVNVILRFVSKDKVTLT